MSQVSRPSCSGSTAPARRRKLWSSSLPRRRRSRRPRGAESGRALCGRSCVAGKLRLLADLNGDGQVGPQDLAIFKNDLLSHQGGRFGGRIQVDLNGDGVIDDSERCWPRIDLNGSGRGSDDSADVRPLAGATRSDLEVLRMAWTDPTRTFDAALRTSGLGELIEIWQGAALTAAMPGTQRVCHAHDATANVSCCAGYRGTRAGAGQQGQSPSRFWSSVWRE